MGAGKSLPSLEAARTIDAGQGTLQCVCFDRSGGRAASGGEDGSIKVWDTATRALVFACLGHEGPVLCARYARVGDFLCSGGRDATARVWDAAGGLVVVLDGDDGHGNAITGVDSVDGDTVVTASMDATAIFWDSGAQRTTVRGHATPLSAVRFSRDGSLALTAGHDGAGLTDASTGAYVRTLRGRTTYVAEGHKKPVTDCCFSDDGRRAVTVSLDRTAVLWDVATSDVLATLKHPRPLSSCDYVGGAVLAAGADGPPRLWDASSPETGPALRLVLVGPRGATLSCALAADGARAAAAGAEGRIFLWDLPS